MRGRRQNIRRGIPARAVAPNAVTALALCSGLTGVRFAIAGDWEKALIAIAIAGVLDGLDGRIARLLKGESRFGAELDSLSDVIAFGVSPAIIMFLWSLNEIPRFGWIFALGYAVCAALRLARFNASIDTAEHPRKVAGFLTGVPAPLGAGLMLVPVAMWLWSDLWWFRDPYFICGWAALVGCLMISDIATYSWSSLHISRAWRLPALLLVAMLGAALFNAPWHTLSVFMLGYLATVPFSAASYRRIRRRRATPAPPPPADPAPAE
ncbi:CDP-alcohol phosphatidyltransferase family protein [Rhizorhabdus wittichii]|jgi:CDP-diacylglycerol--serine O-phosphatidyltransferase|uniref:CDP-alcohol phosphatidyltransferase family protein n=1 Tax=Rhizorhabdus wittichii TaxID=160791 RepID=UPI0002EEF4A1|nr:phosphatidylcholine/phosphatidylserine synthase [Rhizorhabdus wittichii]